MKTISVTKAASKGIVMGKAFLVVQQNLEADKKLIRDSEKDIEVKKFDSNTFQMAHNSFADIFHISCTFS